MAQDISKFSFNQPLFCELLLSSLSLSLIQLEFILVHHSTPFNQCLSQPQLDPFFLFLKTNKKISNA